MGSFAEIVLILFIPLAVGTFFVMRPLAAALVVALGGDLFLPGVPTIHISYFPVLDKHNLPYVCILIGCLLRWPRRVTKLPKERWFLALSALVLVGGAMTGLTNNDVIPCLTNPAASGLPIDFKAGMAIGLGSFVAACLPFFLGYVLIRDQKDVERALIALAVAGLIYSPLAILEMRLSPQLSGWVYGSQGGGGQWDQGYRWGGYRPTVFMPHGLALARFFMATTLALFVLAKQRRALFGLPAAYLAWFNALVLLLCRSTGAIVFGAVGILSIMLTRPKRRLGLATVVALVVVFYPLLRSADLFPVNGVLSAAGTLGEDRQGSLGFRFMNEDLLLAHARERILFGWGAFGRNMLCDIKTVTDGHWIIVLGESGLAGFLASFGVLTWPILLARRRLRGHRNSVEVGRLSGLAVILALLAADLIPNGLWCYYPFFFAGILTRGLRLLSPSPESASERSERTTPQDVAQVQS
jgi:hypothetical protein